MSNPLDLGLDGVDGEGGVGLFGGESSFDPDF